MASWMKTYVRRMWKNKPSLATPLNETNLNAMDFSLDMVDTRIVTLSETKADITTVNNSITGVAVNSDNGVMTFTKQDGTTFTVSTTLGKIAVNFEYNPTTQKLVLHHKDGTTIDIDLADLVNQFEFDNTSTVVFEVGANGHISAKIPNGSITDAHLRPDYLADIIVVQEAAQLNQENAEESALLSEAWAVGKMAGTDVKTTDSQYHNNSKYYSDVAKANVDNALTQVDRATSLLDQATKKLSSISFYTNFDNGHLYYDTANGINMSVNLQTGHLMYELTE